MSADPAPTGPFAGPQPELVDPGTGLLLRLPRRGDEVDVHEACQDPATQRWTTIPVPYGPADATWYLEQYVPAPWREARGVAWLLGEPGTGRYAGAIDLLLSRDFPGVAEVGFVTVPRMRGRGLMPAAVRLACRFGFEHLGVARVEWRAYVGNEASRRVARKVGFGDETLERGKLVQRGVRHDCWAAGLLPGDLRRAVDEPSG